MKKDFYISYASADTQWAEWIADTLEECGYSIFVIHWDVKAGDNWSSQIENSLKDSEGCVCILSPRFMNSKFATDELNAVLASGKRLILIRVEEFHVSDSLKSIAYIDLVGKNEEEAKEALLSTLGNCKRQHQISKFPSRNSTSRKTAFPKQLCINNLPLRNNYFTGYNEQLNFIANAFKNNDRTVIRQSISGLGGIGKTQLAIEYAYRYALNYQTAVWFVNAESSSSIYHDFIVFAHKLSIKLPQDIGEEELSEIIRNWMQKSSNWLIIFDNLEIEANIAKYIPTNPINGHILVTTRNTQIASSPSIDLSVFTHDEAIDFLKLRLANSSFNYTEACVLAKRLGYLPLALEQAAAYIPITQISIHEYLELIDSYGLKMLDSKYTKPINYTNTISTTIQNSIMHLSDGAQQLLNLIAYMAPDDIPIQLFIESKEKLPEPLRINNQSEIIQLLAELRKSSLISGDVDNISIHRLTQEAIRQSHKGNTKCLDCCFAAILYVFPNDFSTSQARIWFARLVIHAEAVLGYMNYYYPEDTTKQKSISGLYSQIGNGYNDIAHYSQALESYNKVCFICEKILGTEHPDTATSYNDIAVVYNNMGDYQRALEWYRKALAIREMLLGAEHPDTAATYNNIAMIYYSMGDYQRALEWYRKALAIREMLLGVEHPDTATTYNNIAAVYDNMGDYSRALEWGMKALAISEKVLGKDHPSTAATYTNIAAVYNGQGEYLKALLWYQKALAIYEKVLGKDHPTIAAIYNNIAEVYYKVDEYDKSLAYYANALQIYFNALGESHPSVQMVFENVRKIYTSVNRPQPFDKWLQEAFIHGGDVR